MKRIWLLSLFLLTPGITSCGCNLIAYDNFEPSTLTLVVGETAPPPQAVRSGCTAPLVVEIEVWVSDNPAVASVDEQTGVVTAVAPGETTIRSANVGDEDTDTFVGTLTVTVVAPRARSFNNSIPDPL